MRSKHYGIEARWENPKLGENPNFGIMNFSRKSEDREIFSVKVRIHLEFIENILFIRTGAEKYSGLIAGRKFDGRTEI